MGHHHQHQWRRPDGRLHCCITAFSAHIGRAADDVVPADREPLGQPVDGPVPDAAVCGVTDEYLRPRIGGGGRNPTLAGLTWPTHDGLPLLAPDIGLIVFVRRLRKVTVRWTT